MDEKQTKKGRFRGKLSGLGCVAGYYWMLLDCQLVEPAGIEPASVSPLQKVLHAYPVYLVLTTVLANRQAGQWRVT